MFVPQWTCGSVKSIFLSTPMHIGFLLLLVLFFCLAKVVLLWLESSVCSHFFASFDFYLIANKDDEKTKIKICQGFVHSVTFFFYAAVEVNSEILFTNSVL